MLRANVMRHRLGVGALIVPRLDEPHRVRVNLLAGHDAGGGGREQRRVEPAAREHADRHVGHELALDRAQQCGAQCRRDVEARRARRHRRRVPVTALGHAAVVRDQDVPGLELRDAGEHRAGGGNIAERGVQLRRGSVHAPGLVGKHEQRL